MHAKLWEESKVGLVLNVCSPIERSLVRLWVWFNTDISKHVLCIVLLDDAQIPKGRLR